MNNTIFFFMKGDSCTVGFSYKMFFADGVDCGERIEGTGFTT